MDLGQRVAILEAQVERLVGNGQPGEIALIWQRLERNSTWRNRAIGAMLALQAVSGVLIALMAAGVVKIR